MKRDEIATRAALSEFLGFIRYKVLCGAMTFDDMRAILAVMERECRIKATVKEIAGFYNQSEDNVRHVVHRNLLPPPERRVYYDFGAFRKVVPSKWRERPSIPEG